MTTISAEEAARMLDTDHVLLERRVRAGKLHPIQQDGNMVFERAAVAALARCEAARDAILMEINEILE